MRSREDFATLAEFLEMQNQGAMEVTFGFRSCAAGRNASGHVGRVGEVAGSGFLDDDEIFFHAAIVTWTFGAKSEPWCESFASRTQSQEKAMKSVAGSNLPRNQRCYDR